MYDALSFTEIDGQHVELLPTRTVLSMFSLTDPPAVTCLATSTTIPGFILSTGGHTDFLNCQPTKA